MDPKYRDLVRHILWSFDTVSEMVTGGGASDWTKGEEVALKDLVTYLKAREDTTEEGLREKFKEES